MHRFIRSAVMASHPGTILPARRPSGRLSDFFRQAVLPKIALISLLSGGIAALPAPGGAATNLVKNGNFESSTGVAPNGVTGGITGLGRIKNGQTGYVTVADWSFTCFANCDPYGYNFTLNKDTSTVGANNNDFPWADPLMLWKPAAVTSLDSPNSGLFLAIDGVYGRSKISQNITGLDTGKSYTLSFEYAGGQQKQPSPYTGYTGATDQTWIVRGSGGFSTFSLGSKSCGGGTVNCWTNPDQGFTPWQTYSITFTPTATSLGLEFEAWGTVAGGTSPSGDNPPFLLLDNVQLVEADPTPAPGPLPVVGVVAAFAFARRLRRRVATGAHNKTSATSI